MFEKAAYKHKHTLMHRYTLPLYFCPSVFLSLTHTRTHTEPAVWWKQVSLSAHYPWQGWSPCLESNKTHLTGEREGWGGRRRRKRGERERGREHQPPAVRDRGMEEVGRGGELGGCKGACGVGDRRREGRKREVGGRWLFIEKGKRGVWNDFSFGQ